MRILLSIVLLSLVSFHLSSIVNSSADDKPLDVDFCDLITSPHNYDQKEVRIKAVHRVGFEWSELYSLKCSPNSSVWVTGIDKYCDGSDVKAYNGRDTFNGRTVGLVAVGRLHGEGGYGHMNAFDFKFEVRCIEKAEILLKGDSVIPQALSKKQRDKIKKWESSN